MPRLTAGGHTRKPLVNRFQIFFIRAVLGGVFAVILSRFFYPEIRIPVVMGLGILLVGLSYVSEYFHNRNKSR